MSETRTRPFEWADLVEQALAAVDRPALVCDADGRVRGRNDALVARTALEGEVVDEPLASVVDAAGDPLARAVASGETTTGSGTVTVEDGAVPCLVTCRPLGTGGEETVGAVVTLELDDRDDAWSLLAGSVAGDGDYVYAVDAEGRVRLVDESFERETGVAAEAVEGEPVDALGEYGVFDETTVRRVQNRLETLRSTDRTSATFNARVETDGRERVLEHRLRAVRHHGETAGAVVVTRDVTERVRATEALRESHARLSTIVDNLPVVVAVVDEDERVEFFQGGDDRDGEYEREDLLGTDLATLEAELPGLVDGCRRALDGETLERTVEVDGRTLKCFFEPLERTGEQRGVVATTVDITERVEKERQLAASNRRLDLALRNTDAGVFEWQVGNDLVYWHDSLSELLGLDTDTNYRPTDVFQAMLHPDDREKHRQAVTDALDGDGEFSVECRIEHPDKGRRWLSIEGEVEFDDDGDPVRIVGTDRDVTDRKEREQQLREERERFEKLLETSPVGITILDTEGQIVRANERAEDVLGLSRSAITDRTYDDPEWNIVDEDGDPIPSEDLPYARVLDTGESVFEYEHGIEWPDGTERWLSMNLAPLTRDGEIEHVISVITDITERKERQRQIEESQEKLRTIVESSPDPILMKDTGGRYQLVNEAATELTGLSKESFVGRTPTEVFGPEYGERVHERTRRVLREDEPETVEERHEPGDDQHVFLTTRTPFYGPEGQPQGVVSIRRDITERRRKQDQLETLARIQQLIHESVGALAAATTESEIKRTVCERLAGSPFYEFAWMGRRDPSSREVSPDCWAGIAGDYLDEITVTVDPSESGRGPVGRAYRSGEVAVVSDVDEDPDFSPWREAALERGLRSVAAVPLTHGPTTHGVLVVYADRPAAFSERELAGFEALGGTVGFALSAAQNRRLLESETVLELEFVARPDEPAFRTASLQHDCELVFDGVVGTGDGKTLCYLTVEGADPDAVAPAVEAAERVERAARLDGADGPHFELAVSNSTFQSLADAGARGTRIVVENGHARVAAEAPTDVDVRRIQEALETHYRRIDFVTRREVEPTDAGWVPTGDNVGSRLTDRQRSVLRAAYYSGYYDWPRETDAETLADSLDIATSTTLQHLRKGHRRVMSALFDS